MSTPPDATPRDFVKHVDLPYVADGHARQRLDLYLPPLPRGHALPLIVYIHGGAFRMGDKASDGGLPIPLDYLARGYAIASINYRLSQHAIWPAQIEDCKAAVRWLRAHAEQFGLDPARFAAWGPSAGGHLAAMLGVCNGVYDVGSHLDQSSAVQCVVDYYGPTDFLQMDAQRPVGGMLHDPPDSPESELIGGAIQQHPDKTARANPITYVSAQAPPFLIVHGDADPLVPHPQSVLLERALRAAGVPVQLHTVTGGGHGRFQDPAVPTLTRAFLDAQLLARRAIPVAGPMIPPMPAIVLSIRGLADEPDELSVLWTFVLNGNPAQVGVSAEFTHRALRLIDAHGEFVLNVPTAAMVKGFDLVDMNSSKSGDKFALSGFTRGRATMIDAPTVEESPIQLECRVFNRIALPPSRVVFFAEVLTTRVTAGSCDADGRLIVPAVPFFGMTAGSGEFYTVGQRVGQIGQSANRTDIRY